MSNINNIIFEGLFRARGIAQKLRPSVIAYKITHNGLLPLRNIVSNGTATNKLFNGRLYDSNLKAEWLNRLFNSPHVPSDFDISSGFDSNNVAFISFKNNLTPRLKQILSNLEQMNNVYIDINKSDFDIPLIVIAGDTWYTEGPHHSTWENWFDSVTSALEDSINDR